MIEDADRALSQQQLQHCANEPIQTPGAIQPHGCLLAFDTTSLVVQQVSTNVEVFLGLSATAALNRLITDALPPRANQALMRALAGPAQEKFFALDVQGRQLDGLLHEHEGTGILEIEPASAHPLAEAALGTPTRRLMTVDTLQELFQATAETVQALTGFDRVLVYRFDDDGHGEVISEASAEDIESYLGLHYPESDIPRQARALYLRDWIRSIPDARYTSVPLALGSLIALVHQSGGLRALTSSTMK